MIFEFTREQREAWRVFRPIALEKWLECALEDFDAAAARFDAREATCGIEPLSFEHGALLVCTRDSTTIWSDLERRELVDAQTNITDRGREVLAALNAMCKVQK